MAQGRPTDDEFARPMRRVFVGIAVVLLLIVFAVWRIDNPRMERFRAQVIDAVVPNAGFILRPLGAINRVLTDYGSYLRVYEQNQELRRELQRLRGWRETALQLEQKYARLLDLNKVKLNPKLTFVTALVTADSGSPFSRSVIINVGDEDGIMDGWAATDSLGLVGRVAGVGGGSARVLLITDAASRVPVIVQPSGKHAILSGDNSALPLLDLVEARQDINAGDRVVTSGRGGVFPPGLLVGQVVTTAGGTLRLRVAADMQRLEFLQVLRSVPAPELPEPGVLAAPPAGGAALPQLPGAGNDG